jgi:hypothetical protein
MMAAPYSGRTIDYLGSGLLAARPAAPNLFPGTVGLYYCTDIGSEKLTAWDGAVWADVGGGGGGSGTVTSVDGSGGTTGLTLGGGPITGSGTLTLAGILGLANGGTGAALTDPNADRVLFWDDSAGAMTWLAMGSNLSITGTTLDASGGGSYTGAAGRISITGSVIDIDATYSGQNTITTLGTVATGAWNATAISAVKGGTGQTGYTTGDLLYASSTTALSKLGVGSNGQVLTLSAGLPVWAAGGLTNPMSTAGDIIIGGVAGAPTRVGVGSNTNVLTVVAGVPAWAAAPSGGTPAGSNLQVQYNNGGAFGAEAAFAYDQSTNTLSVDKITMNGLLLTLASATGAAGFRLPHGAAPSAPVDGDVWTTSAGGMYVRINGVTVGPLAASGGGGLTNWTEAVNGSSPNATIPVVSWVATNAATNVDVALVTKGNGSISAHVANSSTSGGNKRGRNSVDWQKTRSASANVASGDNSTIGGGEDNLANSSWATVAGGSGNSASNSNAVVGGGANNTASGSVAVVAGGSGNSATNTSAGVLGGSGNTATGQYSSALGGLNGTASGDYGTVLGGRSATTRGCQNAMARAAVTFLVSASDTQWRDFIFLADTTDNTPEVMTANNSPTPGTGNTIILPDSSVYIVRGYISARQQSTGDVKAWMFEVVIKRNANAAATSIVGTPTITVIAADAGLGSTNATGSVIALSANTTLGGLAITITGETSKNIKWAARIFDLENVTA